MPRGDSRLVSMSPRATWKAGRGVSSVPAGIMGLQTCPGLPNLDFSYEKNKTSKPLVFVLAAKHNACLINNLTHLFHREETEA